MLSGINETFSGIENSIVKVADQLGVPAQTIAENLHPMENEDHLDVYPNYSKYADNRFWMNSDIWS